MPNSTGSVISTTLSLLNQNLFCFDILHVFSFLSDFQRLSLKETWKRGLSAIETQRINMKPGQCERKNKIIFQATALIHKHVLDCAHEEVSNYTKR